MNSDKGLATIVVCILGAVCMWLTKDATAPTGIGWAFAGLVVIWAN